jgi:hypothetical protein
MSWNCVYMFEILCWSQENIQSGVIFWVATVILISPQKSAYISFHADVFHTLRIFNIPDFIIAIAFEEITHEDTHFEIFTSRLLFPTSYAQIFPSYLLLQQYSYLQSSLLQSIFCSIWSTYTLTHGLGCSMLHFCVENVPISEEIASFTLAWNVSTVKLYRHLPHPTPDGVTVGLHSVEWEEVIFKITDGSGLGMGQ